MAGIYIHVPFCKSRCFYCDFFKSTKLQWREQYLCELLRELRERRTFFRTDSLSIESIYFGGGTPSLISVKWLEQILKLIYELYPVSAFPEITLEANPDDLDAEYLKGLNSIGFNRLSLGIQSFFDEDLQKMGRRHNAMQGIQVLEQSFTAGFKNVGLDLIYGLPWTGEERMLENLKIVGDYPLKHLSAYHLTIEPGTRFGRDKKRNLLTEVNDSQSENLFWLVHDETESMGFDHYEISNFCKEGFFSRHNTSYWTGNSYLGVGPGAHSFDGKRRLWNKENLNQYLTEGFERGISEEFLTEKDHFNERLMLGLRTKEGIDIENLKNHFSQYSVSLEKKIDKWINKELLQIKDCKLSGTRKGWFLIDGIIEDLFVL